MSPSPWLYLNRRLALGVGLMSLAFGLAFARAATPVAARPVAANAAPAATQPDTAFLRQYAETNRFRSGEPVSFAITRAGDAVLFLRSGPRSLTQDLWMLDLASGEERVVASAARLMGGADEQLTAEERARRERMRVSSRGIVAFQVSEDDRRILVPLSGRLFVIERGTNATRELKSAGAAAEAPQLSPDGRMVACVRDGDLWVTEIDSGAEHRLTTREDRDVTYGAAEFVAEEEMARHQGFWWSFDSQRIAFQRTDTRAVERMTIADPSHPEREARRWAYPRPGKTNAEVRLFMSRWDGSSRTEVTWDRKRYPYLCTVRWDESSPLTLVVINRRQTELAVLKANEGNGATSTLLIEKDAAWLNLDQSVPRWLEDGKVFLWSTERRGEWQLELRAINGALVRVVTPPHMNYRKLVHVDDHRGVVWVRGGAEPTEQHVLRVPIRDPAATAGSAGMEAAATPMQATHSRGWHDAHFSINHDLFVHSYDLADGDHGFVVNRFDGSVAGRIRALSETPRLTPHVTWETVGSRKLRALVVRPSDFDPAKRYPVILHVYGGPHAQEVKAAARGSLLRQWYAECGFIVVSIDGRGTPARGRVWERTILNDLITLPLADQVDGLEALAAKHPEMDLSRTGIFGWSFGGYFTAIAVMQRPDVFASGVAGAPVVDWGDYDTFYTERYLGLPETSQKAYQVSSVLTYVPKLERPLLIAHGAADDNVYFFNSLKLMDALTRAGRSAEFLPLIGQTHSVADPALVIALQSRIAEHFRRTLGAPR